MKLRKKRNGWNIMINGNFRNGCIKEALTVLIIWWVKGFEADCATEVSMLPVYGYSKELEVGRRVYALLEMVNMLLWKVVLHNHKKIVLAVGVKVGPYHHQFSPPASQLLHLSSPHPSYPPIFIWWTYYLPN